MEILEVTQTFFNTDACSQMAETYLQLFSQPWAYGLILGTLLDLLGYGIFKAISLVNIK